MRIVRPYPPAEVIDDLAPPMFRSAPELREWVEASVLADSGPLVNEDHAHLRFATIGYLWTNVSNARKGRVVVGQAEIGSPQGAMGKWAKARAVQQIEEWFGAVPDFIMTIDAGYAARCSDAEFCALVEHELYHMAQAMDEFGNPKFSKDTGRPIFTIRGHDVEEFVGVVRRYGADAAHIRDLIEAAQRGPEIAAAAIASACGTCLARAA